MGEGGDHEGAAIAGGYYQDGEEIEQEQANCAR